MLGRAEVVGVCGCSHSLSSLAFLRLCLSGPSGLLGGRWLRTPRSGIAILKGGTFGQCEWFVHRFAWGLALVGYNPHTAFWISKSLFGKGEG